MSFRVVTAGVVALFFVSCKSAREEKKEKRKETLVVSSHRLATAMVVLSIDSLRAEYEEEAPIRRHVRSSSRAVKSLPDPGKDPIGFLLHRISAKRVQLCASDPSKLPANLVGKHKLSRRKKTCDVYVARDDADLRQTGLERGKPGGHVIWSWPKKDEIRTGPKIYGEKRHPIDYFLIRHLLDDVFFYEYQGMVYHLLKKPVVPFENPSLKHFIADRANPEYLKEPRAKEAYAFVITIPYNFDRNMALEHMTAVYQLRKKVS